MKIDVPGTVIIKGDNITITEFTFNCEGKERDDKEASKAALYWALYLIEATIARHHIKMTNNNIVNNSLNVARGSD